MAHQTLIIFGIVVGVVLTYEVREWFPTIEDGFLLMLLWVPIYALVLWPAMFALLGNYRLK